MKNQLLTGLMAFGVLTTAAVADVAPVSAATIGCASVPGGLSEKISGSIGCEISGTLVHGTFTPGLNNDNPVSALNNEFFFGANNWIREGKSDAPANAQDGLPAGTFTPGTGQSGTFDLSEVVNDLLPLNPTNFMLVFKSGQGTSIVGYLMDNRTLNNVGTWLTPFTNPPFPTNSNEARDVSHISVYYRLGDPLAIPTPALLPGLLGMGVAAWRKRQGEASESSEA